MKPNVLWIYCDELRTDALGCYGHPTIQPRTPHIDAIAHRGVRFNHNFCNSPICTASRTCILSGAYCEQTGVYANEAVWKGFEPPHEPLCWVDAFNEAGYATANFGKVHVRPSLRRWQHHNADGSAMNVFNDRLPTDSPGIIRPAGVPTLLGGAYPDDDPYPPERTTDHALTWLGEQTNPWLCRVSILQPHTPVYPPPWAVKLFADDPGLDGTFSDTPNVSGIERRDAEVVEASNLSPEQIRLTRVYYHALVAWIDTQVGRLMDWLGSTGLAEQTIIVFESDHGAALGEGGRYAKQMFSPAVHRVPRLIAWPGTIGGGAIRDDACQSIDLGPTLLAACDVAAGEPLQQQMQGRDLFSDAPHGYVFSTIGHGQPTSMAFPNCGKGRWDGTRGWPRRMCVRTDRYRYDRNVLIDGQPVTGADIDAFLCDYRADPAELTNLAGSPELADVEAELAAVIDTQFTGAVEPVSLPTRP